MRFEIEIDREPGDGRWIAEVLGLPGCSCTATSEAEAVLGAQARALRVLAERMERGAGAAELVEIAFGSRRHPSLKTNGVRPPSLDVEQVLARLNVAPAEVARLCAEFQVAELSLFGSVLRVDFRLDSDVDALVTFLPEARVGLFQLNGLQTRLGELFQRKVDLVPRNGLKPLVAKEVLPTARLLYAAGRGLPEGHPHGE
jgi:uncharacterized protein